MHTGVLGKTESIYFYSAKFPPRKVKQMKAEALNSMKKEKKEKIALQGRERRPCRNRQSVIDINYSQIIFRNSLDVLESLKQS